ncbi:MAG: PepSY domain-containing protein [Pleurocapsa sp. SU_196_0]|nr:PepSY domain-containing protein [Pleurocapsa sp. SU_196_0]
MALAFKLRLRKTEYLRQYDWHKIVGFVSLPFLAMWALTALNFYEPWNGVIKSAWYAITFSSQATEPPEVKSTPANTPALTATQAAEIAKRTIPDARLVSVGLPDEKDGVVDIWMARGVDPYAYGEWPGNVNLKLDAFSGAVLDNSLQHTLSWGADVYTNWSYPIHAGIAVPWWARLVWLGFGLVPLVLAYTGLRMWWLKRRARKTRQPLELDLPRPKPARSSD